MALRLILSGQKFFHHSIMTEPEPKVSNVYLAPAHLNHIRATIDWKSMFDGLSLKRDKRKSKRDDWWAYSPFKQERTASFHMGPSGIWYDFSVGMGGGPIELIQRLKSCNCYEAANFILDQGWATSALSVKSQEKQVKAKVARVSKPALRNDPIRQDLLPMCTYHDYLEKRGISEKTCRALGIGYLPQGRSPLRGRVVFQIRDARPDEKSGKYETVILSHMGRAEGLETRPKYLFYEGFHKSAELYGQDIIWSDSEAHQQMQKTGAIVLTEGPFDVAKTYEAGLRNVVASFGAKLSERQSHLLYNMCKYFNVRKVLLAYDRDAAGYKGVKSAAIALEELGIQVECFEWKMTFSGPVGQTGISKEIRDLSDFNVHQIKWLRQKSLI